MIAVPALFMSLWILRNYLVFGRWVFLRSNLGLELSVSNNSCATFGIRLNEMTGCYEHPNISVREAEQLAAMGEPAYNEAKLRSAIQWIREHPQRFVTLSLQRFWFFWFPSERGNNMSELRKRYRLIAYCATLLSLPGLLLFCARNRIGGRIFLLWLGWFPLIHYIVQFEDRYRVPIYWLTLLLAGFTITRVLHWLVFNCISSNRVLTRPVRVHNRFPRPATVGDPPVDCENARHRTATPDFW
jgi:hypothetical protein